MINLASRLSNFHRLLAILTNLSLCACMEIDPSLKYDRGFINDSAADRGIGEDDRLSIDFSHVMQGENEVENASSNVLRSISEALTPSAEPCLGPWMCRDGLGCVNGNCGGCQSNFDCPRGMVCELDSGSSELGLCTHCDIEGEQSCDEGLSCIEGLCLHTKLIYYEVELNSEAWSELRRERYQDTLKAPCLLKISKISELNEMPTFDQIHPCHIKVHGGSSRDLIKLSWRLTLEEPIGDITWGDDRIILRAEYNDLSLMRNVLSFTLFEHWTALPTSRWRYIWLNVNGEDQGIYLQIEKNHDEMMRRWGRDPDAPRYEADININDMLDRGASGLIPLPMLTDYWKAYERLAGLSYAPLIHLIEEVIGDQSRIDWLERGVEVLAEATHLESYLRYIAVMRLIQNLDSIRKNYVISFQSLGDEVSRWEVYPWDLDLSWGCLFNDLGGTSICDETVADVPLRLGETPDGAPPTYPVDGLYNMLTERSLSPTMARAYYERLLCELTQDLEDNPAMARVFQQAAALTTYLSPWVSQDASYRGDSLETFLEAVEEIRDYWEARRSFINQSISCDQ